MDTQKNAADRMRPILQAMERSIDQARRNRVKLPEPAAVAALPASPVIQPTLESYDDDATPRLKARPKRLPSPFLDGHKQPDYHSQAG